MIYTTLEKIAFVQCYIHHVKGVEVDIETPTNSRQWQLLEVAFQKALNYFR